MKFKFDQNIPFENTLLTTTEIFKYIKLETIFKEMSLKLCYRKGQTY